MEYPWSTSLKIECPVVDTKPGFHPVEYGSLVCAEIECLLPPKGHAEFIGNIHAEKILIQEAHRLGVGLRDVMAERGFEALFPMLFTNEGNTQPELRIESGWVDLQVITGMTIDPPYRTKSVVVRSIDTLIGFLGARDLVMAVTGKGCGIDLTAEELLELHFTRITGTNVALRTHSWAKRYKRNGSSSGLPA